MRLSVMKKAAIGSVLYSMAAMGLIYYLSNDKVITISDVAQDEVEESTVTGPEEGKISDPEEEQAGLSENKTVPRENRTASDEDNTAKGTDIADPDKEAGPEENAEKTKKPQDAGTGEEEDRGEKLIFGTGDSNSTYMRIPLPEECKAEDIVIENYYMNQELCILVGTADADFYEANAISGNLDMVKKGLCEAANEGTDEKGVKLRFSLTGIFEYHTILENHDLYVNFLSPREMYDKIVVIDPYGGGSNAGNEGNGLSEKDITLQVAKKIKEKLDESDIKVYYTRMDDSNPGEEDRVRLANETRADMYIRIQVDANEDSSVYGATTIYNEDYFIPGFGSVELADILEREVVTSIKGKALGLTGAEEEDYAVRSITVPAAAVKVGCLTNKQEAILLGREEYQDKIADGICNAVQKVYEDKNQPGG
ncbi:N-acetylmuramoyl-L-alanine amidase family protein [Parablautia intestinalis]|uniref:N-acetylmuramoyl-L-alanine amidase family protein n=1 Tax=Parablautia intestinalis TaxID=2320100 RepID=UPI00259CB1F1|nr:N-acetylmuramoyl-L-alanine amidase [Parablautia intestinalis]